MSQLLTACKFISVFCLTFILGYASMQPKAVAQFSESSLSQLESRISTNAGVSIDDLDYSDLEFNSEDNSNLYLVLYSQYNMKSVKRAINGMASVEGLSQSDAEQFILNGNSSAAGTADATKLQSIRETYQLEKELFQSLAKLEAQTVAYELFSNGNQDDSTFDLITDLNEIEDLLFAEVAPSQFGDLSDSSKSAISRLSNMSFDVNAGPSQSSVTSNNPTPNQNPGSTNTSTPDEPTANGLACPIDSNLAQDIHDFETSQTTSPGPTSPTSDASQPSGNTSNTSSNSITSALTPNLKTFSPINTKCQNAIAQFGDLFCLRVETIRATAGLEFVGEQYCVNCLINKLATLAKDLNSESVTPRKITGKFGELAVCKNQIFNAFSLNISFIPAPARPDLQIVDIIQDVNVTPPVSPTREEVTVAETLIRAKESTDNLIKAYETQALAEEIVESEQVSANIESNLAGGLATQSIFVKDLSLRLTIFKQNFTSIREQISQIQADFNQLNNKKACS